MRCIETVKILLRAQKVCSTWRQD